MIRILARCAHEPERSVLNAFRGDNAELSACSGPERDKRLAAFRRAAEAAADAWRRHFALDLNDTTIVAVEERPA